MIILCYATLSGLMSLVDFGLPGVTLRAGILNPYRAYFQSINIIIPRREYIFVQGITPGIMVILR
jgi:hypothetical protein